MGLEVILRLHLRILHSIASTIGTGSKTALTMSTGGGANNRLLTGADGTGSDATSPKSALNFFAGVSSNTRCFTGDESPTILFNSACISLSTTFFYGRCR